MLKKTIRVIFILSSIGLILSIVVHALSIYGVDVTGFFNDIWFLQAFGIGLAAITIILYRTHEYQDKKNSKEKTLGSWETILDGIPRLYVSLLILFAAYAFFNIMVLLIYYQGSASIENGEYVLTDHGIIIDKLTKLEYDRHRAGNLRAFSSGWVVIYGLVFLISSPTARFWKKK